MNLSKKSIKPKSERTVLVKNKMGVHARPAAMIVRLCNKFEDTQITVQKGNVTANAKSIMGVIMLAANEGTRLKFSAIGPQSAQILDEIENLFNNQFNGI